MKTTKPALAWACLIVSIVFGSVLLYGCAAEASEPPPVTRYRNCDAMRAAGWTKGVKATGGSYNEAWSEAEKQTYRINRAGRDRDKDGWACE